VETRASEGGTGTAKQKYGRSMRAKTNEELKASKRTVTYYGKQTFANSTGHGSHLI